MTAALDTCQELQDVDFKESQAWDTLKFRIVRTSLAMANLRDGGIMVVGVSERDNTWSLDGIDEEHLRTFQVDEVLDQVNRFASPHVDLGLVRVEHREKLFLAIEVEEFHTTPVVCKRNGPNKLEAGGIYVRPPGKAQTTKVMEASQVHDLIEMAAEKTAQRLIAQGLRAGLVPGSSSQDAFDQELGGL